MAQPRNQGTRWGTDDDAELARLIAARKAVVEIARRLGRTQDAVRGRAWQLRLTLPSTLRPWRKNLALRRPRS
jgi:hypothetical protein